jgi:D-3-phosphoglycerate dehydrogenase
MSVNNKRVFYVKYLSNEIYVDILRARPDVRLDRLENESPEEIAGPILAAAHAYQVGAAAMNWRGISTSTGTCWLARRTS